MSKTRFIAAIVSTYALKMVLELVGIKTDVALSLITTSAFIAYVTYVYVKTRMIDFRNFVLGLPAAVMIVAVVLRSLDIFEASNITLTVALIASAIVALGYFGPSSDATN